MTVFRGEQPRINVAQARAIILTWDDISDARKRDLRSSLATLARMAGRPAELVNLTPADLRPVLSIEPAMVGSKKKTLTNVKCSTRYVMRRLGLIAEIEGLPNNAWRAILEGCDRYQLAGLVELARYCSSRGIEPSQVTEATLAELQTHLERNTLTANPKDRVADIRMECNKARRSGRMPGRQLSKPTDDRRFALREIDFSPNFQRAMKAFGDRFTRDALDDDPLSPAGSIVSGMGRSIPPPPRTYRLSTVRTRTDQIRWAASALVKLGTPVAEIQCLDDLVTPIERVSDILRFFRDRAGGKRNATAGHVGEALRIVAKYVAGLEDREIEKIKLWTKSVAPQFVGMTEKNELIVHRALEKRTYENLLRLPGTLISVALESLETNPVAARALAFRAAQLQFLLILPLRLDNVLHLRIGDTLKIPKLSCAKGWVISIPLHKTKNSNAILLPVPEQVALILRQWIEKFKNPESDCLFPGHVTLLRPMTPQAFREALKKTTRKYVGVEISPHVFRHIAANSYLREFPGHYEDVRRLLGHKAVATTTKFYSLGETISANKKFDELTLRLKGKEK